MTISCLLGSGRVKAILCSGLAITVMLWFAASAVRAAQELKPDDDLKMQLAALQKQVSALVAENNDLKARLAQQPVPTEAEQLKRIRQGYDQACKRQGLKFKQIVIEAQTGKVSLVCGP